MNRLNKLEVFYHERLVGTIALYQNRLAAFEYDSNWLANGFSISPFPLPLEKKVFIPKIDPFEGLLETSHRIPNLDYDNVAGNCHRRMTSPTVIQSVESMLPR